MRQIKKIKLNNIEDFKNQLLLWAQTYDEVAWLDSNQYKQTYSNFDAILAVDAHSCVKVSNNGSFNSLESYRKLTNDWIFGYFSYDLKNDLENLKSQNYDLLDFPDLYFFQPKKLFFIKNNIVTIKYLNQFSKLIDCDLQKIQNTPKFNESTKPSQPLKINARISKINYLNQIKKLKNHIQQGDIYEANFCQEFFTKGVISPLEIFKKLQTLSTPPFSVFFKTKPHFVLSASPERYMKKEGDLLISQPIKGTAKRSSNKVEDSKLKKDLQSDPKEISENVMIVDLVRNDLSRVATKGSVNVEELHKIHTFRQVHHLISTIRAKIRPEISPLDVIRSSFPMGSMTGAPKISAMNIIESLEFTKRGLYSGAVGYFTPESDFDFNVVIRTILYNSEKSYISYSVGSAITSKSIPSKEYEECLIKASAMRKVLEN